MINECTTWVIMHVAGRYKLGGRNIMAPAFFNQQQWC